MIVEQEDSELAERARGWVVHLASGAMTDGELAALYAWLGESPRHARAFEVERAFWQRLAPLQATFERLERSDAVPLRARRRRRGLGAAFAAAALVACLLLAVIPDLGVAFRADYRSGDAAARSIILDDGSRVTLDRNAAIAVDFRANERRIELLEGAAFFEVRADAARPFRVLAGGGVSEAIGTAYAVRLEEGGARVVVTRGRVAVSAAASEARRGLVAGEGLRYSAGRLGTVVVLDAGRALAWREGRAVLVDRPLAAALAELERYHPGRIVLLADARTAAPVSAVIDLDRLDEGIAALAATHGLTVHRLTPYLTVLR